MACLPREKDVTVQQEPVSGAADNRRVLPPLRWPRAVKPRDGGSGHGTLAKELSRAGSLEFTGSPPVVHSLIPRSFYIPLRAPGKHMALGAGRHATVRGSVVDRAPVA